MTDFDRASLAQAAGVDPWALLKQLQSGDPAQIEALAAAFYKAGGQMADADAATQRSQGYVREGYTVQGAVPPDFDAEATQTKRSTAGGADRLPKIAKLLSTVAGDLDTATSRAAGEVSALNGTIQKYENEWTTFFQGTGHHLPEDDWAAVKQGYVNDAVAAVKSHGATVNGYVTGYETTLGNSLKSMADLGYIPPDAVDEGPGDVNLTSGKAQADARLLLDGESSQPPGQGGIQKIQQAEETVALLNAKVKAGYQLTPEEQSYLDTFYNKVGPDGLAKLPGYVNAAASDYPRQGPGGTDIGTQEQLRNEIVRPLANGIMNLSNPSANADGQSHVPKAVTDLENTPIGYRDPDTGIVWANKDAMGGGTFDRGFTVDGAATYNGFADLMGSADATGGTDFTKSLGESAIRVKQQLNTVAGTEMHLINRDPFVDPDRQLTQQQLIDQVKAATDDGHVGEMLGVVAHNGDASAQMLLDTHDREAVLGMNWGDDAQGGAAGIIHAGTDRNVPVAQQDEHARAALAVMTELGGDRTAYEAHVTKGVDGAVLDMANQYIDTFAQPLDPNTGSVVNDALTDPFGHSHTAVVLSDDDRAHFLEYLMHGDGNAVKFHAAADAYSQDQLAAAFQTHDPDVVQKVMTQAGALDGSITKADFHDQLDIVNDDDKEQAAAYAAAQHRAQGLQFWEKIAVAGGGLVINGVTDGAASPIVSLATPAVNDLFKQATDPGSAPVAHLPTSQAQLNDANNESYQLHRDYLIASAAHQAGLPVDGSIVDASGNMVPYDQIGAGGQSDQITALGNTVYNLDERYGADRQSFDTPYQAQVDGQYWDDRGPVGSVDQNGWRTGDTARAMLYGDQNWQIISHNPLVDLDHEWPDDATKLYELPR